MLHEFTTTYTYDTGDATIVGTGSGVHLYKDVTFNFGILDRTATKLATSKQIFGNPYVGLITVDILDTGGNIVYTGYDSGYALKSFTLTERENIDIFGAYTDSFGIGVSVADQTTAVDFNAEFYVYGNRPNINSIFVNDGSGYFYYDMDLEDVTGYFSPSSYRTTTGLGPSLTGGISFELFLDNNPKYCKMSHVDIYASTGYSGDNGVSGSNELNSDLFFKRVPITQQLSKHFIRLGSDGLENNTNYYFKLIPYGELGPPESGYGWVVGPHYIHVPNDPEIDLNLSGSGRGIVLSDENGISWKLTVNTDGSLQTTAI